MLIYIKDGKSLDKFYGLGLVEFLYFLPCITAWPFPFKENTQRFMLETRSPLKSAPQSLNFLVTYTNILEVFLEILITTISLFCNNSFIATNKIFMATKYFILFSNPKLSLKTSYSTHCVLARCIGYT